MLLDMYSGEERTVEEWDEVMRWVETGGVCRLPGLRELGLDVLGQLYRERRQEGLERGDQDEEEEEKEEDKQGKREKEKVGDRGYDASAWRFLERDHVRESWFPSARGGLRTRKT